MKTCKECLHYEVCKVFNRNIPEEHTSIDSQCEGFTNRSEWVHLPNDDYIFTIRSDIAKGIIIANCRAADKLKGIKEIEEGSK